MATAADGATLAFDASPALPAQTATRSATTGSTGSMPRRQASSMPTLSQSLQQPIQGTGASSSSSLPKHPYLSKVFKVGQGVTYSLSQKIFHASDVRTDAREAKQVVQQFKKPNVLGTEPAAWNQSTVADHRGLTAHERRLDRDNNPGLKQRLLRIRAGVESEKILKGSKLHDDSVIAERQKYIVNMTGKGPIGMLSGKWFNHVDERGLSQHGYRDDWPDWNQSHSCHTKEDQKQAQLRFQEREAKRKRTMEKDAKLNAEAYVGPQQSIMNVNAVLRERKIDYQDLKEHFKHELKNEFPQASEERLQAMAQRLLKEKLLADEKQSRFPAHHETFKPNTGISSQDRRYKVHFHPGTWAWSKAENRYTWSCCLNFSEDSVGCEFKVVNPDAWCVLGFERRPGQAATAGRS